MPRFVPAACLALSALCGAASGQNLLVNPSLFLPDGPPQWDLQETSSSLPSAFPDSATLAGFAASSGAQGLWLQEFTGLFFGNGNELASAVLSQTVPAVVGNTYTFSGFAAFEGNYSGGVTTLDPGSPSGAAPSPTQTYFELAFLNGSGGVIGSPSRLDLRTVVTNGGGFGQGTVMGTAPAGAVSVRVTGAAIDMIPNVDPQQSAFFDNFSLRRSGAPSVELLANADLEEIPPSTAQGWTVTGVGGDSYPGFAAFDGPTGFYLQSYLADLQPERITLLQTVPVTAGTTYDLSGYSYFDLGYSGGVDTLDIGSPYGAVPSLTKTEYVIQFKNASGQIIATSSVDLKAAGQTSDQVWRQNSVSATAPAGAVSATVGVVATDVMANVSPPGGFDGAYFDKFDFRPLVASIAGDFNGDGRVDSGDLSLLLSNWGTAVPPNPSGWTGFLPTAPGIDSDELSALLSNWGAGSSVAVPEPAAALLAAGLVAALGVRRRS